MPVILKEPNDPWPDAAPGLEIVLAAGDHQPGELAGQPGMTVRGETGARIVGGKRPSGGEDPRGLRVHDGAHGLQLVDFECTGSDGGGIKVTAARGIRLAHLLCHDQGIEGILLGNCPHALLEDLAVRNSRRTSLTTDDRRHGVYVSGDASGTLLRRLAIHHVTGSAVQANGAGLEAIIYDLLITQLVAHHCGSGGTPALSFMAVQNSTIERFTIARPGNTNDRWAVLFADGHGPDFACYHNTFREYTVPDDLVAAELEGSRANTFEPGAGWLPGQPPTSNPDPDVNLPAAREHIWAASAMIRESQRELAQALDALGPTDAAPPDEPA